MIAMSSLLLAAAEGGAHTVSFPLLSMLVIFPLIGALVVMFLPTSRVNELVMPIGLMFAAGTGALAGWLMFAFKRGEAGYQFVTNHEWIRSFGSSWHLGVDGISLWLVVLTGFLFPLAMLGPDERFNRKAYVAWILLLEAGVMGVFLSLDLFLFFVMFEVWFKVPLFKGSLEPLRFLGF